MGYVTRNCPYMSYNGTDIQTALIYKSNELNEARSVPVLLFMGHSNVM